MTAVIRRSAMTTATATVTPTRERHPLLGTIVVDAEAAELLCDCGLQLWDFLARHLEGDLGDTAVMDTLSRAALWTDGEVRSSYLLTWGTLRITTDIERPITTVRAA
jgi:hypothetical protein